MISEKAAICFMGWGVWLQLKSLKSTLTLGDEGICDGIDPWFVFGFLEYNKHIKGKYHLLLSDTHVQRLLEELDGDGLVVKNVFSMSEITCYLASDIQNANPIKWKPYSPDDIVFEDRIRVALIIIWPNRVCGA